LPGRDLLEEGKKVTLQFIVSEIEKILSTWHYAVASKFLKDAEHGVVHEAENDAITLVHLLDQQEELMRLKGTWVEGKLGDRNLRF
jgi:hypothetical protein